LAGVAARGDWLRANVLLLMRVATGVGPFARSAASLSSEHGREVMAYIGSIKTPKKARASRENGKKGGRPHNPKIQRIMEKQGCSRQRAYRILKERES
jgi:hypothetical protein